MHTTISLTLRILILGFALLASFVLIPEHTSHAADILDDGFHVEVGQRQLFLDDHGIDKMSNVRRTMHRPTKRGAVIRSPQPSKTIQTRTAPVRDAASELYKIWVITVDDNLSLIHI